MLRITYAYGYRTRVAAEAALEDSFAHGDVSHADAPAVESYANRDGATRYRITLNGMP